MVLSLCCGANISIVETENGGYYICDKCKIPCRVFSVLCIQDLLDTWSDNHETEKTAGMVKKDTISALDGRVCSNHYLRSVESVRATNAIAS